MLYNKVKLIYTFIIFLIIVSCDKEKCSIEHTIAIIPEPHDIEYIEECFDITKETVIINKGKSISNISYLQDLLLPFLGNKLKLGKKNENSIQIIEDISLEQQVGKEGYLFSSNNQGIIIKAANSRGVFYGIQSLRQLLPTSNNVENFKKSMLHVPGLNIKDVPRFEWRAFMLDESRHFKGGIQVKKLMDQMALLKMNTFHWHLTDDQGWRIEIKKYPKLTEIGSSRDDTQIGGWNSQERSGEAHQGFYTQEEIKDIIEYANNLHIKIIPEIEMPGHAMATIVAYPWLGTLGRAKEVPVEFGVMEDCYNVADQKVKMFLEDVLSEIILLFPSNIIHIGGDEVKYDAWKTSISIQRMMKEENLTTPNDLQIYFTNEISQFLNSKKRRMMGWNDIVGDGVHNWQDSLDTKTTKVLSKSSIVHFWKGDMQLITNTLNQGYEIVNSYHEFTYLDYNYRDISLEKAYNFNPVPEELSNELQSKILGLGCQMWSEWIPKVSDMDRQIFPRIAAYAEVGWTSISKKDYTRFKINLEKNSLPRWENINIAYFENF